MNKALRAVLLCALAHTAVATGKTHHNRTGDPSKLTGELRLMIPSLTTLDSLAVCADGSDAYYYFRKGFNPTNWVVYLQGGPVCYDDASCSAQMGMQQAGMSSKQWVDKMFLSGIFATDSTSHISYFADANVAMIGYCSGDGFLGDSEQGSLQFRGQRIVAAAMEALVKDQGLGTAPNVHVLFGGCSVGGMYHVDNVRSMLKNAGAKSTFLAVSAMFDSVLWVDLPTEDTGVVSIINATQMGATYLNASDAVYGTECLSAYGQAEAWKCLFPQYRLPYVQTSYLLAAPQFDRAQLTYYEGRMGTPAAVDFAVQFQAATQSVLAQLPSSTQAHSAVFSLACYEHCSSLSSAYWNEAMVQPGKQNSLMKALGYDGPVSLQAALRQWYFQGHKGVKVVQECTGWRCGGCSGHSVAGAPPGAAKAAKAKHDEESSVERMAGPMALSLFLLIVCCGCCMACASAEEKSRKRASMQEDTPLVPASWRAAFPNASKMYMEVQRMQTDA